MIAPLLQRSNRRAIFAGLMLAIAAQAAQATLPLIQSVILDDTILSPGGLLDHAARAFRFMASELGRRWLWRSCLCLLGHVFGMIMEA